MTMTWGFGIENRDRLLELWELSPKTAPLRDIVWIDGQRAIFEVANGVYRRIEAPAILDAIERAGSYASWPNMLADDFHEGVASIGVPFHVDAYDVQYIRDQSRWLMLDEESESLADHGLTPNDATTLNLLVNALADVAIDHHLVMRYG